MIDDALFLFPESVLPLMYLKAIVCQLMWSEIGPLKMKRCDVLEEGLYYLRMVSPTGFARCYLTKLKGY